MKRILGRLTSRLGERAEAGEALTDVAGVSGVSISSARISEHYEERGARFYEEDDDNNGKIGQQRSDSVWSRD